MATGIRLKGTTFSNASLPSLGDFGYLSKTDLDGLFKMMDGAELANDLSSSPMVLAGSGSGGNVPTVADGIIAFPNASPAAQTNYYNTGVTIDGAECTRLMVLKPKSVGVRDAYIMATSSNGTGAVNLMLSSAGSFSAVLNNGTTRFVNFAVGAVQNNLWRFIEVTHTASQIRCSVNGGAQTIKDFSEIGGAPTWNANRVAFIGAAAGVSGNGIFGDVAFHAVYNRALSAAEVAGAYRGVRAWLDSQKGISI